MTDLATTRILVSPASTSVWDRSLARAQRLDALHATIDEHRRELSRDTPRRWPLGLSLMALGGGF